MIKYFIGCLICIYFGTVWSQDSHYPRPGHHSIPFLSISLNIDRNHYLRRLLRSIDFPIDIIGIQIGNTDESMVRAIIEEIQLERIYAPVQLNIQISTLNYNPGSAIGFNFGLRNIMYQPAKPAWGMVINSDIAFYPGVLKKIARHTWHSLHNNPQFGIGFTSLCCGSEWSAVVFTRRLIEAVGYFDENFYPAYYEDDDYGIRIGLSPFKAVKFDNTPLQHGELDGSKDYLSGVFSSLYLAKDLDPATKAWRSAHELGTKLSKQYIEEKWNLKMGSFTDKVKPDCKSVQGINEKCAIGYKQPFDDKTKDIKYWKLDRNQFNHLKELANVGYRHDS